MTSKRQQTISKREREREVKERRARKLEKKYAAAAERKAKSDGTLGFESGVSPDPGRPPD